MLNSSFIGSVMNMSADVEIQQNYQDPDSGAIIRGWVYDKTIQCKVEPIKSGGASTKGDSKTFAKTGSAEGYSEKLQLRVKSLELLSRRWRITNIRSSDNKQVFVELDRYGEPDTIFEVFSSHAVLDPFGKVSYYEAVLQRVPIQTNDKTDHTQ
jgi:hypothetical protein